MSEGRDAQLHAAILKALVEHEPFGDEDITVGAILAAITPVLDEGWTVEWQVVHRLVDNLTVHQATWSTCETEAQARRDCAQAVSEGTWGDVWIERRSVRMTEWEQVD